MINGFDTVRATLPKFDKISLYSNLTYVPFRKLFASYNLQWFLKFWKLCVIKLIKIYQTIFIPSSLFVCSLFFFSFLLHIIEQIEIYNIMFILLILKDPHWKIQAIETKEGKNNKHTKWDGGSALYSERWTYFSRGLK